MRPSDAELEDRSQVEWVEADSGRLDKLHAAIQELPGTLDRGFPSLFNFAFLRKRLKVHSSRKEKIEEGGFASRVMGQSTFVDPIVAARLFVGDDMKGWKHRKYKVTPSEAEQLVRENEAMRAAHCAFMLLFLQIKVASSLDEATKVAEEGLSLGELALRTDWKSEELQPFVKMMQGLADDNRMFYNGQVVEKDEFGNLILCEGTFVSRFDDDAKFGEAKEWDPLSTD